MNKQIKQINQILRDALHKIKPSKKEEKEVKDRVQSVIARLNKGTKDAKAILGGSGIKGTWLKNSNDVDIFVKFNYRKYKDKSEQIPDILAEILKRKNFKTVRLHGSRDYFQIRKEDTTLEVIPILNIKSPEQAKNITDISPMHARWVNKKGKGMEDEIRLLKQFCKSAGVYGAESYIQGFSGYICEILVIYYRGFINMLRNAAKWGDKVIIDIEGHWKGKNILMELNKSKTASPLVVIDPVHPDRNAAAAISREKFELFKSIAGKFLRNPSISFFESKERDKEIQSLRKKAAGNDNILALVDVVPKKGKRDVVGCKLIKALNFISKKLREDYFGVIDYGLEWGEKALFYFIIKKEASGYVEKEGPPLKAELHVRNFKKKYKQTFVRQDRIYARARREHRKPEELIESLKNEDYLKEKISSFRIRYTD